MSRRDEYRRDTLRAIHRAALSQLEQSGAGGISLNGIARELGMTGPALFRYVASRDDLLTELISEAYRDLGDALWDAVETTRDRPAVDRLRTHGRALREWALANPHRYLLIFGSPVPGYAAPPDVTQPLAARALASTFALGPEPELAQDDRPLTGPEMLLAAELLEWATRVDVPVRSYRWLRQALIGWTRLHGVLSLELEGHFGPDLPDPEVLYYSELEALADEMPIE